MAQKEVVKMKQALIVGGTKGFGKAMVDEIAGAGFETHTVGRTAESSFVCDIADAEAWQTALETIKEEVPSINLLACVVGFSRAKKPENLTNEDWSLTYQTNLGYVLQAVDVLKPNIIQNTDHRVITIGSRWSLRKDCPEMLPYIEAKHRLKEFVTNNGHGCRMNNYCVPPMNTPGLKTVLKSFEEVKGAELPIPECGDVHVIASRIVSHSLATDSSKGVYLITPKGEMTKI